MAKGLFQKPKFRFHRLDENLILRTFSVGKYHISQRLREKRGIVFTDNYWGPL